jgi:hypothetical protein
MAFIQTTTKVISFADYTDVTEQDSRLFAANEGLTQTVVEDLLVKSTARILTQIRATDWWASYFQNMDKGAITIRTRGDIPSPDGIKIKARQAEFTELCVYHSLFTYILPRFADFSAEDNDERAKIGFYEQRYDKLFMELITAGDWYDFDGDKTVESAEMDPGKIRLRRVR